MTTMYAPQPLQDPDQSVFVDHPLVAVTATDLLESDLYSKLFLRKLGPYKIFTGTAETVTSKEEVILDTISSVQASLASKLEIDESVTKASASHELKYPGGRFGK